MTDRQEPLAFGEAPEAGVGGEGEPFDLTVLAPRTDAEIEQGVRSVLQLDPDVQARHFEVRVEDGVVALRGRSASPEEQRRAAALAEGVHGVKRVVAERAD